MKVSVLALWHKKFINKLSPPSFLFGNMKEDKAQNQIERTSKSIKR
jgi:hypothetical protein